MLPRSFLEVRQVIRLIKSDLEEDSKLARLWVKGETSNVKVSRSGHTYFTIKDDQASLRCVMFASGASRLNFDLADGMEILVQGRISVFEAMGSVQLYANSVLPLGQGELYAAFVALKEKLGNEGLFDRARAIPMLPRRIGIVTSARGAVLHDISRVAWRRHPAVELVLAPASVQGRDAPAELIAALDRLNRYQEVDVIILGRGGGSLEDLMAFNDEALARAIARSALPVVSAVGHETDYTIADFVSDLRAPTPSAAAELVIPDVVARLSQASDRLLRWRAAQTVRIERHRAALVSLSRRRVLQHPMSWIAERVERVEMLQERLLRAMHEHIKTRHDAYERQRGRLHALHPLRVLQRGYALVEQHGRIVLRARDLDRESAFAIRFQDEALRAHVQEEEHE